MWREPSTMRTQNLAPEVAATQTPHLRRNQAFDGQTLFIFTKWGRKDTRSCVCGGDGGTSALDPVLCCKSLVEHWQLNTAN